MELTVKEVTAYGCIIHFLMFMLLFPQSWKMCLEGQIFCALNYRYTSNITCYHDLIT